MILKPIDSKQVDLDGKNVLKFKQANTYTDRNMQRCIEVKGESFTPREPKGRSLGACYPKIYNPRVKDWLEGANEKLKRAGEGVEMLRGERVEN